MDELTPQQRVDLQLDVYAKALAALQEAVDTDTGDKKSRDSILLSYIFTFEMAVRALKTSLAVRGVDTPDYASAVLRSAFQARLIHEADLWTKVREKRNEVSHAYDEQKAIEIAQFVRSRALDVFVHLLERLRHHEE